MSNFIKSILSEIELKSKVKNKFFLHIILLNISIWGRFNFLNMARFGIYSEKSYRNNFSRKFPFLDFNIAYIRKLEAIEMVIAGDASFIHKSGIHTYGKGMFWSGVSGRNLPGLEIHSLAAVDVDSNQAYHLETIQTPETYYASELIPKTERTSPLETNLVLKCYFNLLKDNKKNRVDFYINHIIRNASRLLSISNYIVYDGFSYKKKFIQGIKLSGLYLVGKARSDSDLRYIYSDEEKARDKESGKLGRPKMYGDKINLKEPDFEKFTEGYKDDDVTVYSIVVYSVLLKEDIKIAYTIYNKTQKYSILFSTDLNLLAEKIYKYYRVRFSIEMLFRDAKQYTGLEHSQARDEIKLNYHFNTSLTAVSLAKYEFYKEKINKGKAFSMRNIKLRNYNYLLSDFIFSNFDLNLSLEKRKAIYQKINNFGQILPRTG